MIYLVKEGLISVEEAGRTQRELMEWSEEAEVLRGVRRRKEIQILEDYASDLRGGAKRLGGGQDLWQELLGGLAVSRYDCGLQRVCKMREEC